MQEPARRSTDAQLLARACRLAPSDAERFTIWLAKLSPEERTDLLAPLQAALSGLVAFRQLENHAFPVASNGLRARLRTVRAGYQWALELARALADSSASAVQGPNASLLSLERSLSDALRMSERLVELPAVHAEDFVASFDLFLRDLRHNVFFAPADPLEFNHAGELLVPEELAPDLADFTGEAAKMTTMVALLTLLRAQRFLGIADREVSAVDGVHRAQILVSAVRRELRTLTRFLLVQGIESLADDFASRLPPNSSRHVESFRKAIEGIAMDLHMQMRTLLDEALPQLDAHERPATDASRFHRSVATARQTLEDSAKQLRWLALDQSAPHHAAPMDTGPSERLREEIWAFRFVLWAFADKVSAAARAGREDFVLVDAFLRHWAAFGPRLAKQTDYPQQGPLLDSVAALKAADGAEPGRLRRARQECLRFCAHLNGSLGRLLNEPSLGEVPFDKNAAAARLRQYVEESSRRRSDSPAAAGAFGWLDRVPDRTRASA